MPKLKIKSQLQNIALNFKPHLNLNPNFNSMVQASKV